MLMLMSKCDMSVKSTFLFYVVCQPRHSKSGFTFSYSSTMVREKILSTHNNKNKMNKVSVC